MNRTHFFYTLLAFQLLFIFSCTSVEPPKEFAPLPTQHQLAWQELEYYLFIHFGPNTFTDVEWGDGREDPSVFNPTELNTDQWASIAKEAGMKGIIITAKHHDGFCLWPSEYSTHTVRESPWKGGNGDLLQELSQSCKKYDLKMGVYLSPWDQNHPTYNTPEYNKIFANTLTEVLTNYGPIFEQWFDGATDGSSNQVYDWDLFHQTVYKHQPQAIIFSDVGPGARWIGNERGYAGETNWSKLNTKGFTPGAGSPDLKTLNEGEEQGKEWIPGEVDVSIRPGWFYSPSTDDKVKTVDQLMDIYYASVGRNANLLLNVPPNRKGLIHPTDSTRLMEFKKARDEAFQTNLALGAQAEASNTRGNAKQYQANNLFNGNKNSYWTTDNDITTASIEIQLPTITTFNSILLQEYISLGQRITDFHIEYWNTDLNDWKTLSKATTIGYKRILRTPEVTTNKIKVVINNSLAEPILSNIELYKSKKVANFDTRQFNKITLNKDEAIIQKLEKETTLNGFVFTPYPDNTNTTIQIYNFYTSLDGESWELIQSNASFKNIKNNPIPQTIDLGRTIKANYIKLEPLQLTRDNITKYTYSALEVTPQ